MEWNTFQIFYNPAIPKSLGYLFFISIINFSIYLTLDKKSYIIGQAIGDSDSKESAHSARNPALIPGLRRSPGGHGNPFQYSCLEISMDRRAW